MKIRLALAVMVGAVLWFAPAAQAQPFTVTPNLVPGNFTFQFADPNTGQPINSLTFSSINDTPKTVAIYLLQTGGNIQSTNQANNQTTTYTNILQQLGAEGLGVRIIYNGTNPVVARVPQNTNTNVNANIVANPNFDFITKGGSTANPPSGSAANNTIDTSTNAAITEGFLTLPAPAFPGSEDPLNNPLRMLVAKFTLTPTTVGTENLTAVDAFNIGNQNLTGPVPPGQPADGFHGEVQLDQYLSQYAATPVIPTLPVTVGVVPEPGTMALCGVAAAGFAAWRRRKATPTTVA